MTIPMLTVPAADEHWYIRTPDGIVPHSKYTGPVPKPGKIYCSVTTVLGGGMPTPLALLKHLGNMPSWDLAEEWKNFRAIEGTHVHNGIEAMSRNREEILVRKSYTDREWDMVWGIFRGLRAIGVQEIDPQFVEKVLYDDDDHTAGTADLRVKIGDEWWVIDYKTSNYIKEGHKIQGMKYGRMYQKLGFPVDRIAVLRSAIGGSGDSGWRKDGYEVWIGGIEESYLEQFERARATFWFLNPKAGPKMKEIPEYLSFSLI